MDWREASEMSLTSQTDRLHSRLPQARRPYSPLRRRQDHDGDATAGIHLANISASSDLFSWPAIVGVANCMISVPSSLR
jgi:hypothetical protein